MGNETSASIPEVNLLPQVHIDNLNVLKFQLRAGGTYSVRLNEFSEVITCAADRELIQKDGVLYLDGVEIFRK